MMKVIGEDGTTLADFITYLKSEMLDAVYLQQNSFDPIDANCITLRQRYVTDKLVCILGSNYAIDSKEDARRFFNQMRQLFIDWNYTEFESENFRKYEDKIDLLYQEGSGKLTDDAECLLKGGE
jgi:V/A-type H+-transporting ATPase subunit A